MTTEYTPEQRELQLKWINTLWTTDAKQGQQRLVNATKGYDEFCCLGIYCELVDSNIRRVSDHYEFGDPTDERTDWGNLTTDLESYQLEELGLSPRMQSHCITMNDGKRVPLKKNPHYVKDNSWNKLYVEDETKPPIYTYRDFKFIAKWLCRVWGFEYPDASQ